MCGHKENKQSKAKQTKIFKTRKIFLCKQNTIWLSNFKRLWHFPSLKCGFLHLSRIKSKVFTALHNMEFLPSSSSQNLRKLTLFLLPTLLFLHAASSTVWDTVRLKLTSKSSTPWLPSLKDFIPPYCSTSLSNFTICILCTFPCLFLLLYHNIG